MKKHLPYALFVPLAVLLLLIPLAVTVIVPDANGGYEKRAMKKIPAITENGAVNTRFLSEFGDWFDDHCGLRVCFSSVYHKLCVTLTGDTTESDVIVGSKGRLYYAETLGDYTGEARMTEEELASAADALCAVRDTLGAKGVRMVFTVAPNKASIYPDGMPKRYERAAEEGNASRLTELLRERGVETVDLFAPLSEAAARGEEVYYREDTHWNMKGAAIAYRTLMPVIAGDAPYDVYGTDSFTVSGSHQSDLHDMLYPVFPCADEEPSLPKGTLVYTSERPIHLDRDRESTAMSEKNTLKVVLFSDSFGINLFPYLAANCGTVTRTVAFPYDMEKYLKNETLPDVVVIELVERNLPQLAGLARTE